MCRKVGDKVAVGDPLCVLYTNNIDSLEQATQQYVDALVLSDQKPMDAPLIYKTILA